MSIVLQFHNIAVLGQSSQMQQEVKKSVSAMHGGLLVVG